MKYVDFEKLMGKSHCRVEKKMDGELKKLRVYANTSDKADNVGVKIYSLTGHKEHTFDHLANESLQMFVSAGVKLSLMAIAEGMEEEKTAILCKKRIRFRVIKWNCPIMITCQIEASVDPFGRGGFLFNCFFLNLSKSINY